MKMGLDAAHEKIQKLGMLQQGAQKRDIIAKFRAWMRSSASVLQCVGVLQCFALRFGMFRAWIR